MDLPTQLDRRATRARTIRRFVGRFYLTIDFDAQRWNERVMANPSYWGLLLAAGDGTQSTETRWVSANGHD